MHQLSHCVSLFNFVELETTQQLNNAVLTLI